MLIDIAPASIEKVTFIRFSAIGTIVVMRLVKLEFKQLFMYRANIVLTTPSRFIRNVKTVTDTFIDSFFQHTDNFSTPFGFSRGFYIPQIFIRKKTISFFARAVIYSFC